MFLFFIVFLIINTLLKIIPKIVRDMINIVNRGLRFGFGLGINFSIGVGVSAILILSYTAIILSGSSFK